MNKHFRLLLCLSAISLWFMTSDLRIPSSMLSAYADCSNPSGTAGSVIYNKDYNVPQFCNGSSWRIMGRGRPCSLPSFSSQTGVARGSTVTSNAVTLDCNNVSNSTVTCGSGCTAISRNGGAFVAGPVTGFNKGDTLAIRQVASSSFETTTTASVTVSNAATLSWNVTSSTGDVQTFTTGGLSTWTKPSGYASDNVFIQCWGGGGGGGGDGTTYGTGGGGGGGGAYNEGTVTVASLGATESVNIGFGGTGGASGSTGGDGSTGGSSSFGAILTAAGGTGGGGGGSGGGGGGPGANGVGGGGGGGGGYDSGALGAGGGAGGPSGAGGNGSNGGNGGEGIDGDNPGSSFGASGGTGTIGSGGGGGGGGGAGGGAGTSSQGGSGGVNASGTGPGGGGSGGTYPGGDGKCIVTTGYGWINSFNFTNVTNATPSTVYTSNTITLNGSFTNWSAALGGTATAMSVNGGAWVAGPVNVSNGDTIAIRQTSSASYGTATKAWVSIGSGARSGDWSVKTPGDIQTFTASGTWTKPSGYAAGDKVLIQCIGGGGGGGSGPTPGGGGGGAYNETVTTYGALGATATVTVGALGGAGTGGGASSFGALLTANGGGGSGGSAGGSGGSGGMGGGGGGGSGGGSGYGGGGGGGGGPSGSGGSSGSNGNSGSGPGGSGNGGNGLVGSSGGAGGSGGTGTGGSGGAGGSGGTAFTSGSTGGNGGSGFTSNGKGSKGGTSDGAAGKCIITTGDGAVASFNFTNQTGVAKSTLITSNTVTLDGPFNNLTATCGGASCSAISINGGAFVAGPVTGVNTGDTIAIRQTSSASGTTTTKAWVSIGSSGSRSGDWAITTVP